MVPVTPTRLLDALRKRLTGSRQASFRQASRRTGSEPRRHRPRVAWVVRITRAHAVWFRLRHQMHRRQVKLTRSIGGWIPGRRGQAVRVRVPTAHRPVRGEPQRAASILPAGPWWWAGGCLASTAALAAVALTIHPWHAAAERSGVSLNRATLLEHGALEAPGFEPRATLGTPAAAPSATRPPDPLAASPGPGPTTPNTPAAAPDSAAAALNAPATTRQPIPPESSPAATPDNAAVDGTHAADPDAPTPSTAAPETRSAAPDTPDGSSKLLARAGQPFNPGLTRPSLPPPLEALPADPLQTTGPHAAAPDSGTTPSLQQGFGNPRGPGPLTGFGNGGGEDSEPEAAADPRARWQREEVRVRSGDTFARIMSRAGFSSRTVHDVVTSQNEKRRLRHLRPGHRLVLFRDQDGDLAGLDFPFSPDEKLRIKRDPDGDGAFRAETVPRSLERHLVRAEAEITHSMYRAARRAGLSDRLIMQLSSVFGWEVDLGRDLRRGHRFRILYEEIDDGGDEPIIGDIIAAKLMMGDRVVEAVRFTDGDGRTDYYKPDGTSLRREFKRHPVDYRRISSPFDRNRRHPVLGVRRPHLGVDYAAPTGTPIRAAGEGRVVRRSWRGGYGRVVEIEHGSRYRTLYAHMSRFADDVRNGDRVERGQVIGYVGRSGMATGPHLHYEFIVNGNHRDPLDVELPKADPLGETHQAAFDSRADQLLATLREEDAPRRLAFGRTNESGR